MSRLICSVLQKKKLDQTRMWCGKLVYECKVGFAGDFFILTLRCVIFLMPLSDFGTCLAFVLSRVLWLRTICGCPSFNRGALKLSLFRQSLIVRVVVIVDPSFIIRHLSARDFGTYRISEQHRLRRVCAYAQTYQSLRCSHTQSKDIDVVYDQK